MLTVLIPMAGKGSRFRNAGFNLPKPLILVNGIPMIEAAVMSLGFSCAHIFIVSEHHVKSHPELISILSNLPIEKRIIISNKELHGAATTCLEASELIDNNSAVLIANCDQIMDWNGSEFIGQIGNDCDGLIHAYRSTDPKNSFIAIRNGLVAGVAEKKQISDIATTGIYAWRRWGDFVMATNLMIQAKSHTNGEYYVAPAYNEAIKRGRKIKISFEGTCHLIGTPSDLDSYLMSNPAVHRALHDEAAQHR